MPSFCSVRFVRCLSLVLVGFTILLLALFFPEVVHYYVNTPTFSEEIVEKARAYPSSSVLDELASPHVVNPQRVAADYTNVATKILSGEVDVPGYAPITIELPFSSSDLNKGLPSWQLFFSSLGIPALLLNAFEATNDERYFNLARDMILSWSRYERHRWIAYGFLWNDHAIADRMSVLIRFWAIYRTRKDFNPDTAKSILEFLGRGAEMLAKQGHFTFATNHGVMQNLALLRFATAFPIFPSAENLKRLAIQRLDDQIKFYIDNEGVVLEHSAYYQSAGVDLLGRAIRYLQINGIAVPEGWSLKYQRAQVVLSLLRRTDGSLPAYGDTDLGSSLPETEKTHSESPLSPELSHMLYPVAGYQVWWREPRMQPTSAAAQTIVIWSHFPGHAHKHADELSLLIWSGGRSWLTNTGYWPYGVWGRRHATSWEGSNAPHLLNEPASSERHSELLSYSAQDGIVVSHVRRTRLDGYSVERQVIHWRRNLWLVLDSSRDRTPRTTTSTWTFPADSNLSAGQFPNSFTIAGRGSDDCMHFLAVGSPSLEVSSHRGSKVPFAGWVVIDRQPTAAPAVVIEQPSTAAWTAAVISLDRQCEETLAVMLEVVAWRDSSHWEISLRSEKSSNALVRDGDGLRIIEQGDTTQSRKVSMQPGPDVTAERREIYDAFQVAAQKYAKYRPPFGYRIRKWLTRNLAGEQ